MKRTQPGLRVRIETEMVDFEEEADQENRVEKRPSEREKFAVRRLVAALVYGDLSP
jgi:hypothetical protein